MPAHGSPVQQSDKSGTSLSDNWTQQSAALPRVMVVDDNRANRIIVYAALQALGLTVIEAINGEHAISVAERIALSVIIMDIEMPGISGVDAFRIIRGLKGPNRTIPILAYTAHEDRLEEFVRIGFDGAISKPLDVAHLCNAVCGAIHTSLRGRVAADK